MRPCGPDQRHAGGVFTLLLLLHELLLFLNSERSMMDPSVSKSFESSTRGLSFRAANFGTSWAQVLMNLDGL